MTLFLSLQKNRLYPIQPFVNNRLQHNAARKQESRPRSYSELGQPVVTQAVTQRRRRFGEG